MDVKLIEIRDRSTLVPAMAVKLLGRGYKEVWLLRRAGYALEQITGIMNGDALACPRCHYMLGADLAEPMIRDNPSGIVCPADGLTMMEVQPGDKTYDGDPYILLVKLDGVEAQYDSFGWPNQRTLGNAHRELVASWSKYRSGDVLDVEYVLGEAPVSKVSERSRS